MSGFVLMHREVLEHPLFAKDAQRLGAWLWMVGRACWKPTKFNVQGKTVELARGQFCCTVRELGEAWGMSKSAVDRFLTRLRTETMIGTDSGTGRLIITICNYSKYQDVGNEGGTDSGTLGGTAAGQQRDIKEQGNKRTREEEPNGSPSKGAGASEGGGAGSDDLFGDAAAKPKAKRKREPKQQDPFALPDWVPVDEWQAFLKMRDKIKAPPTDEALRLLVKKLDELRTSGNDPGEVLEQSTMQNWRGIFEVRKSRNEQRNGNGNSNWGASSGNRGARAEKCGFSTAIDDELERLGFGDTSGSSGRWDAEGPAPDQELRIARGRVL